MKDYITLRVEWDADPDDDDTPPAIVTMPLKVWLTNQLPISNWLSNQYGYLVKDWTLI